MALAQRVRHDVGLVRLFGRLFQEDYVNQFNPRQVLQIVVICAEAIGCALPMCVSNTVFHDVSWATLLCAQRKYDTPNEIMLHIISFMYYFTEDVSILTLNRTALSNADCSSGSICDQDHIYDSLTVQQYLTQPLSIAIADCPVLLIQQQVCHTSKDDVCRGDRSCKFNTCECKAGQRVSECLFDVMFATAVSEITGCVYMCVDKRARVLYEFGTNKRILSQPPVPDLDKDESD